MPEADERFALSNHRAKSRMATVTTGQSQDQKELRDYRLWLNSCCKTEMYFGIRCLNSRRYIRDMES